MNCSCPMTIKKLLPRPVTSESNAEGISVLDGQHSVNPGSKDPMNNTRKRLLATFAAIALSASLSACTAPLPGGSGNCDFTVDLPHGSFSNSGYIDGKGKVKCEYTSRSLTNLKIETRLQKRIGISWVTVENSTRTTVQATVKSGVEYAGVSQFISCRTGIFRTQSRGSAVLNGNPQSSSEWQTTEENKAVKDPCARPLTVVSLR